MVCGIWAVNQTSRGRYLIKKPARQHNGKAYDHKLYYYIHIYYCIILKIIHFTLRTILEHSILKSALSLGTLKACVKNDVLIKQGQHPEAACGTYRVYQLSCNIKNRCVSAFKKNNRILKKSPKELLKNDFCSIRGK